MTFECVRTHVLERKNSRAIYTKLLSTDNSRCGEEIAVSH